MFDLIPFDIRDLLHSTVVMIGFLVTGLAMYGATQ